ncbi:hypothetical protein ANO14919_078460 [Xylariales sp. No.14919]|nr:hypothetical protein ANO14919_078460 [Xylariales sp. No.14919]
MPGTSLRLRPSRARLCVLCVVVGGKTNRFKNSFEKDSATIPRITGAITPKRRAL